MARLRSLTPEQAKRTLANKLGRLADRTRQIATNKGVRPYRVFLVWTYWNANTEDGDGQEFEILNYEILPTPRVQSLDGMSFSFFHAGTVPVGSVRLDRISIERFTEDILLGKAWPQTDPQTAEPVMPPFSPLPPQIAPMPGMDAREPHIPEQFEFFYEIIEDGRGDFPAKRARFRAMNRPMRRAGQVDWTVMLERVSQDRLRDGTNGMDTGLEG